MEKKVIIFNIPRTTFHIRFATNEKIENDEIL